MKSRGIYELAISILGMCQNIVRNRITVNQLIFESEKVSKVLEKPFRKLFNFEKSRGVCTGL